MADESADEEEDGQRAEMSGLEWEGAGDQGGGRSEEDEADDSGQDRTFRRDSDQESSQQESEEQEDDGEEDDYEPSPKRPQPRKRRPFRKGEVVTLDHSDDGSDEIPPTEMDTPIFAEPPIGPTLARQRAKGKEATTNARVSQRARPVALKSTRSFNRPQAASSSQPVKRKAPYGDESASQRKRTRVQQITGPIPETPESAASASQAGTQTDAQTDFGTPTPITKKGKEKKEETIWDYFIMQTPQGEKNKSGKCRACDKIVKGRSTSNFHDHQRTRCPRLAEAARLGIPGIMCDIPMTASQSTIGARTGELMQPFSQKRFLAATMKWIVVSGLPFTTIQNPYLQKAFEAANPAARLQSARTLARRLEDSYDIVSRKVVQHIQSVRSTIHYMHDSWTDTGRKNSYTGIYATYIDDNFEYKEILLRLLHTKGQHTGLRMGNGLFDVLHSTFRIATNLGPGTADNASNNLSAANRLATLLRTELLQDHHYGQDLIGCVCHIANIAAIRYLKTACESAQAREGSEDCTY